MKTHAIIPIFIPHAGCPHDCVFCNQKAITARTAPPTLDAVVDTIERNLTTIKANSSIKTVEIAFFGGSFTGIPLDEQSAYLDIAKSYKDRGLIDMIHMSTRPDYIDEKILDNLKKYDADIIEPVSYTHLDVYKRQVIFLYTRFIIYSVMRSVHKCLRRHNFPRHRGSIRRCTPAARSNVIVIRRKIIDYAQQRLFMI